MGFVALVKGFKGALSGRPAAGGVHERGDVVIIRRGRHLLDTGRHSSSAVLGHPMLWLCYVPLVPEEGNFICFYKHHSVEADKYMSLGG